MGRILRADGAPAAGDHPSHYAMLDAFRRAFQNGEGPYLHRNQTIGNVIASHIYEDLLTLGRSRKFVDEVQGGDGVVNTRNLVTGRVGRRGDGSFGELVPGSRTIRDGSLRVPRGPIATLQIGAEMKILAKSMIKQIDRVINDLRNQATVFRSQSRDAIAVAVVGINCSDTYTSYERDRLYPADIPPSREAPEAIRRIDEQVGELFDEVLFVRFKATNVAPFPFEWANVDELRAEYGAALVRISREFDRRF